MNSTGRRRAPWELLATPRKSWLLVLLIPLALVLAGCGARNLISWGPGWSATAASGGVVFVGTRQGEILALNANKNGNLSDLEQEIWVFTPEKDQRLGGVFGMPAVSKEFIFVADKGTREGGAGRLYALRKDRSSSSTIEISRGEWVRSIEGAIVGGPAAAEAEGIVLVGSDDGNLYAFDMTGDAIGKKWSYPTGGRIWSTPTVGNGTVYFGSMDGNIYALSLEEGLTQAERLKWKYQTDGAIVSKPLLLDGMVIVGSFDKKLYALKADTSNPEGELAWFEPFKGGDWFWAGAVSDGEHIYAPSMDGTVYALDKEGSPIWLLPFKADSPIVSTPVVVEEVVGAKAIVVATDAGRLHLLSARDGDELAIFMDLGSRIKAPLSRDGDTVFVGLKDSTVRGINVRKWGVEVWRASTKR